MKKEATAAGFAPAIRSPRRLIANIQGLLKNGKTRLALTAKKPVGLISVEIGGDEGVVDRFIPEGQNSTEDIQIARIVIPNVDYPDPSEKDFDRLVTEAVQASAGEAVEKFYDAYGYSLANNATTIVDKGTDLWEIIRLANFGRLEKVPQLAYTQINKQMDKLIDAAYTHKGNVLFIHDLKEKWETYINEKGKEAGRPSGVLEMAGYSKMNNKVQAVIQLWRDDLPEEDPVTGLRVKFNAQIVDSRHAPEAMGRTFEYDELDFAGIAMAIFPGTVREDWV